MLVLAFYNSLEKKKKKLSPKKTQTKFFIIFEPKFSLEKFNNVCLPQKIFSGRKSDPVSLQPTLRPRY